MSDRASEWCAGKNARKTQLDDERSGQWVEQINRADKVNTRLDDERSGQWVRAKELRVLYWLTTVSIRLPTPTKKTTYTSAIKKRKIRPPYVRSRPWALSVALSQRLRTRSKRTIKKTLIFRTLGKVVAKVNKPLRKYAINKHQTMKVWVRRW